MLVLSRRIGELLWIGDDITVTVTGIHRRTAFIRVTTPGGDFDEKLSLDETLEIGSDDSIKVTKIKEGSVKFGIVAPGKKVDRKEIKDQRVR